MPDLRNGCIPKPIAILTRNRSPRLPILTSAHEQGLEPISKSPEEDNEAGESNKAQEISGCGTPSGPGFGAATASRRRSAQRANGAYSGLDGVDLA
jgi:hypothetical protein